MSRLSIELSSEEHHKIKALAALQGKTIKDFVLSKLFQLNNEEEQAAWAELEELLLSRIEQAKSSPVSSKSFQQISDDVLKMEKS